MPCSVSVEPRLRIALKVSWTEPTQRLFDHETFGGNGRTCRTCHSSDNGTINPEEVAKRLAADPSDPLFLHDGLDDFFSGTTRIAEHATILIERPLPQGVILLDDPSATSVVLARGVPSTVNTPALDPALMYDMRNPDLQDQASGAIERHALATIPPTAAQLDAIAEFQQTNNRFFSSKAMRLFARGGPPPGLPEGRTPSEKRGREFFVDAPWNPPSKKGVCALCHGGPMLNTANEFTTDATGAPPGWRAFDILVSSRNVLNNPVHTFAVTDRCNATLTVTSPDPGIMITGVYNIPMLAQFLPPEETCICIPHSSPTCSRRHSSSASGRRRHTFMTTQRRLSRMCCSSTHSSSHRISVSRSQTRTSS